ncbi:MAG: HAD family hydrolase [Thermoguttaceae bacterium]
MRKELQGSWKAQAVAFDMDGLMFDTEGVYYRAAETLLSRRGYHYTQSLCDEVMGRPPEYCFRRFIEVFSLPEDWRALQEESEDIFIELLKDGYGTTPGLLELFDELDKRGLPRCVCTSSARRVATEVLKKDGALGRVDFVLTSDDITRGKPDPEIYLKAAARLGVPSDSLLVLEDSSAGASSARAAGAQCFMLRAGHNKAADFSLATRIGTRLDAPELLELLPDAP